MNVSLRNQRSRFASHCLVVLNEVNKHIMPDHDSQLDKVIYSDEKQVLVACFPPRTHHSVWYDVVAESDSPPALTVINGISSSDPGRWLPRAIEFDASNGHQIQFATV